MHHQTIKQLQKAYGYEELQNAINNGSAWTLEGSYGRSASHALDNGICMLPKEVKYGAYGNRIPSRDELKKGTKGTFQNCSKFWDKVENEEIFLNMEN